MARVNTLEMPGEILKWCFYDWSYDKQYYTFQSLVGFVMTRKRWLLDANIGSFPWWENSTQESRE